MDQIPRRGNETNTSALDSNDQGIPGTDDNAFRLVDGVTRKYRATCIAHRGCRMFRLSRTLLSFRPIHPPRSAHRNWSSFLVAARCSRSTRYSPASATEPVKSFYTVQTLTSRLASTSHLIYESPSGPPAQIASDGTPGGRSFGSQFS
jgi:hypothetical protein